MRLKGRVSKLEAKSANLAAHEPVTIIIRSVTGKVGEVIASQAISASVLTANSCETLRRGSDESEEVFLERVGLPDS